MADDKHRNNHRQYKRCFQANLGIADQLLVGEIKRMKAVETDKDLLLLLCEESKEEGR